jgi:6-pyruvoyltetrahydropterin/6-carboxytetrahydropterin synthase
LREFESRTPHLIPNRKYYKQSLRLTGEQMRQNLLEKLAPRLKALDVGGYSRTYRRRGKAFRTSLHLAVAEILSAVGVKYRQDVRVPGTALLADFEANGTFLFVDRSLTDDELKRFGKSRRGFMIVRSDESSDDFDSAVRVIELGSGRGERVQTIFLDDPSFNFDYAHILPQTQKCSVMHGHTSSALVEIVGNPVDGMVVDFGVAKEVIREAIRSLDHKLFINQKYVKSDDGRSVRLEFRTVHGPFTIEAPKSTTVLLTGEATVENLAREVLDRIAPGMPENVSAVGVYVYEGLNKGAHLLAQVHSREVEKSRKKR